VSTFLPSESDSSCLKDPGKKYPHQIKKKIFVENSFFPFEQKYFFSQNAEFFRNLEIFQKRRFSIDQDLRQFLPTSSGAALEVSFHHTPVGSRWNGLIEKFFVVANFVKNALFGWKGCTFFSNCLHSLCGGAHPKHLQWTSKAILRRMCSKNLSPSVHLNQKLELFKVGRPSFFRCFSPTNRRGKLHFWKTTNYAAHGTIGCLYRPYNKF